MGLTIAITRSVCRLQLSATNGVPAPAISPVNANTFWSQIFSFDPTHPADFQPRAVTTLKKLKALADNGRLVPLALDVTVVPDEQLQKLCPHVMPTEVRIYLLSPRYFVPNMRRFVYDQAHGQHCPLIEPTYFKKQVFAPGPKKLAGWLEMDNGALLYRDYSTFERTAEVFGVKHSVMPAPLYSAPPLPQKGNSVPKHPNAPRPS